MKIALTFDVEKDIPHFLDTIFGVKFGLPKILNILEDFNLKATFFCTGNIVKCHPEYIKLIESKSHEIACHGLNHERLNQLNFQECQDLIFQNKKIIEKICDESEVVGFRTPYLKPPKFLFKILDNLEFKYDSSIVSPKKLKYYYYNSIHIQEFHPLNSNFFFRLPLSFRIFQKWIYKKELVILFFHPWEAINIKRILLNHKGALNIIKNIIFRPDRWYNTGNKFIKRFSNFLRDAISKNIEFVTLNQLIN
ncbi:MAG: polysaccharide deacetylase family protein [Candidatus Hermodarchaeota archaeon]